MTLSTEAPQPAVEGSGHAKRDLKSIVVPAVLVLLGVLVLMYPVVATQWNNIEQQRVADEYAKFEEETDPTQLNKMLEDARKYNEGRKTGPILDPWLAQIAKDNQDYRMYEEQLNQHPIMARLVVTTGQINLPIYHGTEDDTLQKGVGHLFGSDLPVGGSGSHTVLTGHTGLSNATLFDNLKEVKEGDAIYVQVSGEKLKYRVDQVKVVLPEVTEDLRPEEGKDLITLVTCTPYGINSHRLLVRGHRVDLDPEDLKAIENAEGSQWQWWMWALVAGAIAVAAALLYWLRKELKKEHAESHGVSAMDLIRKYELEGEGHE
ncbi:class C sortase [Corynebacterium sp. H128]|uniref:class C sortase n=1 Tax=unclassified Corynebacterium TaxID=2624378 RepID=UPI0030963E5D